MIVTSGIGRRCDSAGLQLCGFTLIELLVVLAILVLLAAFLPLAINRMVPARRVSVAADRLATDVRLLQVRSTSSGQPQRLTLLPSGYRLGDSDESGRSVEFSPSMTLEFRAIDGRVMTDLTAYPDGTSIAGRFEISYAGRNAIVEISMLTGRTRRVR